MIYAYVGLPGAGKSYGVVANQIIPALRDGRVVVTNIPLYEDRIRETVSTGQLREFPTEKIQQEPELIEQFAPPGCVLIIDELWRIFPAGQKVNNVPEAFKRLLAEHRHMVDEAGRAMQIVFVTQDLAQIGAFARQLVDQTFLHKKLDHLGFGGSYTCTIYRAGVTGQNPPDNAKLRSMTGRYEEKVYRLYKSHTMSQSGKDGANETTVDRRGVIWKRPGFIIFGVAVIAMCVVAPGVLGDFFGAGANETPSTAGASGATAPGRRQSPMRSTPAKGAPSAPVAFWRVSGFIEIDGETWALLSSSDGQAAIMDGAGCQRTRWMSQCKFRGQWVSYDWGQAPEIVHTSPAAVTQPGT